VIALATITHEMKAWNRVEYAIRPQAAETLILGAASSHDGPRTVYVLKRTKIPCVRPPQGLRSPSRLGSAGPGEPNPTKLGEHAYEEHERSALMPEGYCVKERKKVEIKDPQQVTMKNGRPAIQGTCPDCGTKIFKIGKL
jgi:hypothetical protein